MGAWVGLRWDDRVVVVHAQARTSRGRAAGGGVGRGSWWGRAGGVGWEVTQSGLRAAEARTERAGADGEGGGWAGAGRGGVGREVTGQGARALAGGGPGGRAQMAKQPPRA
ncbi:hypothetical protein B1218_35930 [Pseudomonas ogarae]|nr:hypothetical protein B1218_35930 [Pseudomonas ogarae]